MVFRFDYHDPQRGVLHLKGKYNTKQRKEILSYLENKNGGHFTAAEVYDYFKENQITVGMTTVYRQLDQMVNEGLIKKYVIDESSSACFEYVGERLIRDNKCCYHLKCEKCGKLIHLECEEITGFEQHITEHHGFRIDPMRTVFYGLCAECVQDAG